MKKMLLASVFILLFFGCSDSPKDAQYIVDKSIKAHGFDNLQGKQIHFQFRDYAYEIKRGSFGFEYARKRILTDSLQNSKQLRDYILNGRFTRKIDKETIALADSISAKYYRSVNSVAYFFQLPYGLNDSAVKKEYLGVINIENQPYYALKVTFNEVGGGEDFEDEFRYYIHLKTFKLGYLSYRYFTDEGGVRFRKASAEKYVDSMLFLDYQNYKAPITTDLDSLPYYFHLQKLSPLSRIENENIQVFELE